jgi:VanZ family protein
MELHLIIYPILLISILLAVRFNIVQKYAPRFSKKGWDKVGHMSLYFTATMVLAFLFNDLNINLKFLFFPMCVIGIFHEIRHYKIPERNFEFMDMAANFMGVLLAYFLIQILFF